MPQQSLDLLHHVSTRNYFSPFHFRSGLREALVLDLCEASIRGKKRPILKEIKRPNQQAPKAKGRIRAKAKAAPNNEHSGTNRPCQETFLNLNQAKSSGKARKNIRNSEEGTENDYGSDSTLESVSQSGPLKNRRLNTRKPVEIQETSGHSTLDKTESNLDRNFPELPRSGNPLNMRVNPTFSERRSADSRHYDSLNHTTNPKDFQESVREAFLTPVCFLDTFETNKEHPPEQKVNQTGRRNSLTLAMPVNDECRFATTRLKLRKKATAG
eukprot:GHVR01138713.1.p1 GENE.GHVR01138713.1~~GHVR01138713.1.p1  ORF type:complete len:270 (+),score=14.08 GHVR01138713.1:2148-2957(+)